MSVADIVKTKGRAVKTIRPDETAKALAEHLKDERIGAMIVSHDGSALDGIISERDLAYSLAIYGDKTTEHERVGADDEDGHRLRAAGQHCRGHECEVMNVMTQRRIRHLPVKDGEQLIGIISIGDVLKHRLGEIQLEANVLRDVAVARR